MVTFPRCPLVASWSDCLRKTIGYNSEQEIDNRIASIEFQLCTESVPLKDGPRGTDGTATATIGNLVMYQ